MCFQAHFANIGVFVGFQRSSVDRTLNSIRKYVGSSVQVRPDLLGRWSEMPVLHWPVARLWLFALRQLSQPCCRPGPGTTLEQHCPVLQLGSQISCRDYWGLSQPSGIYPGNAATEGYVTATPARAPLIHPPSSVLCQKQCCGADRHKLMSTSVLKMHNTTTGTMRDSITRLFYTSLEWFLSPHGSMGFTNG